MKIPQHIEDEMLEAMDVFKTIAESLIAKLIAETKQPEMEKIKAGHYYEIDFAESIYGESDLSDNWDYWVHSPHCHFSNKITGQDLEVRLGSKETVGNLDPIFFYNFLKSTEKFVHLTHHFNDVFAFREVLNFFKILEQKKKLKHFDGAEYQKI